MELFNLRITESLFLYAVCFLAISCYFADGYQFKVGGRSGWVLKPNEAYGHWAERNRFQVNDTLYFKYDKHIDSVLVVDKTDYENCNTAKPKLKLEGGESVFKFDRSGPFFFITSNVTNCQNGQKAIIVVLAVRHRQSPPPVSPSPPNTPPSPVPSPSGYAPSPAPSSMVAPPAKNGGVSVFGPSAVVLSVVSALVGLSMISI